MSDELPAWFDGRPGRLVLYRVNRRPMGEDSLFPAKLPGDVFEHFVRVLAPGQPVVTGHQYQRIWRLGGLRQDQAEKTLTGRLGWQPKDVDDPDPKWSDEEMDWQPGKAGPKETLLPFGFDGESRLLVVVPDRKSKPSTIGEVFEQILRMNERELPEVTTEWSVEPILDRRSFEEWLNSLDVVRSVSFTARLPNPAPADDAYRELVERLQHSHATHHSETMRSEKEGGLVEVIKDRDLRQAVAMAQQGFATLSGKGTREGKASAYSQRERQASESVEELPHNWSDMRKLLVQRVRGPLRRFTEVPK